VDPKLPIRSLDYTVIFARQMAAMRDFYGTTPGFPLHRQLSPRWVEFRVGSNLLVLTERGGLFDDPLFFRDPDGNVLEIYAEI
jgi:catechol 2,3-dioxygenase-like lactoylglutathione lyase family enzyme